MIVCIVDIIYCRYMIWHAAYVYMRILITNGYPHTHDTSHRYMCMCVDR